MLLAGSADGPQPRPKSSDAAGPRAAKLLVHYQSVVNVAVWAMVACGAIALIEPSPYDFASFIAIPLWIFGGVTIHRSFLPFFFLLLLQAIVGFFTLLPYWSDADAVLYQYQTAYLTLTGLFFALYVGERTEARTELILKAYTVGALVAAVTGILGYFDVAGLGEAFSRYGRASGTFKDPNVLGSFVILGAVYLMQNLLLARARSAVLSAGILAVLVAGTFLSFSRGSWGAAIFAMFFMIVATFVTSQTARDRRRIVVIAIVAAILIVLVVAALLSFDETRDFFLKRAALTQDYDEGATGRFGNQMRSLPMLLDRFGGFGPLRFRLVFGLEPHNSYIGAFANGGWVGGLLFVLIVGITTLVGLRLMFKRSPYQRLAQVYFPALMAFFLQAFQIDIDHWRHVLLILGVVWGLEAGRQKSAFQQALAKRSSPGANPAALAATQRDPPQ